MLSNMSFLASLRPGRVSLALIRKIALIYTHAHESLSFLFFLFIYLYIYLYKYVCISCVSLVLFFSFYNIYIYTYTYILYIYIYFAPLSLSLSLSLFHVLTKILLAFGGDSLRFFFFFLNICIVRGFSLRFLSVSRCVFRKGGRGENEKARLLRVTVSLHASPVAGQYDDDTWNQKYVKH